MKPHKPRIVKPRLLWKWSRRHQRWEPYHRVTWSQNGKNKDRLILLRWEQNPKLLDDLYWQCENGKHEKQVDRPVKYTWARLVELWRDDPRVQANLAAGTKVSYRRRMDGLLKNNAGSDVQKTTRPGLRKTHALMVETPREANWRLQIVSLLWNYAKFKQDWPLGDNPATGIDHFPRQREFKPWPQWMVNALEDAPFAVRGVGEIMLNTGQRPGASVDMQFGHFEGDYMSLLDEKTTTRFEVFCPPRLTRFVESIERRGAHILAKNLTQPLGYDAIEKEFRAWRKTLGPEAREFTLHGLRKLAIISLAEAGCSDAEIQAITNQSLETIAYYRRMANRKVLSRNAQKRVERNENRR